MTALNWADYERATTCDPYGPDGARALLVYTEDVFAELGWSMGICNCRNVAGSTSKSHHAECRALDYGFARIVGATFAYDYARILGEHGRAAGFDHLITNKKPWASDRGEPIIFSNRSPEGRVYTGSHPHKDHDHIGLTRVAGKALTYSRLVFLYGTPAEVAERLMLEQEENVEQVYKDLQQGLKDAGYYTGTIDGIWGPLSKAAYSAMCNDAAKSVGQHHHPMAVVVPTQHSGPAVEPN